MWAWIQAQLANLLSLFGADLLQRIYQAITDYFARQKQSQDEIDQRGKAVDNAVNAQTPEDAYNAEQGIINSEPKSP